MRHNLIVDIENRLTSALPNASRASLHALATTLVSPSQSLDINTATSLLQEGCSPYSLHASFVYCRDAMLRQRLPKLFELPEPERIREIELLLSHFDYMQAQFTQAVEEHWQTRLEQVESQLLDEGQAHLLTKVRNHWLKEGYIEIYNHHRDALISARVPVVGVRENGLSVTRTPDLVLVLAAGEHRRYAHTRLPDSNLCLRMGVEGVHGLTVHWQDAGIMQLPSDHRRFTRANASNLTPITLIGSDNQPCYATLHDFSASGFGVMLKQALPISIGDVFQCETQIRDSVLQTDGRVCWTRNEEGCTWMGLELDANYGVQHRLRKEVGFWRQQIRSYLKLQGMPDCLMPSIEDIHT